MNPLRINLDSVPGAIIVLNSLLDTGDPKELEADLVLVRLPGNLSIDVSWHPENDPEGTYAITLFRRNEFDQPLRVIETKSAVTAARLVEMLSEEFAAEQRVESCSQETHSDFS